MTRKFWQVTILATVLLVILALLVGASACTSSQPSSSTSSNTQSAPGATTTVTATVTQTAQATTAKPKDLIFESFIPPSVPVDSAKAFIKGLSDVAGGTITCTYNIGAVMGPPTGTYQHIIQGVADWGEFNPGYTPGVFPMSDLMELPAIFPNPVSLGAAMWEMKKKGYFDAEYSQTKFLWMNALGPYQLYSNKKVSTFADFAGMKMRTPNDGFVQASKALGGTPVSIAGAELYTAMEKGIVDACWANGDMAFAFKLQDVSKYIIMLNLGNSTHAWAMNKNTFNALPVASQKYIDSLEGSFYMTSSERFNVTNAQGLASARAKGVEFINLPDSEMQKVYAAMGPIFTAWADAQNKAGRPGTQALKDYYDILHDQLNVPNPFPKPY